MLHTIRRCADADAEPRGIDLLFLAYRNNIKVLILLTQHHRTSNSPSSNMDDYGSKLIEHFNKRSLPRIPSSTRLTPVLLKPAPKVEDDLGCVSEDEWEWSWIDSASEAIQVLQLYNRYANSLQGSDDEIQRHLSSQFIDLGRNVTKIVDQADQEVRIKLGDVKCAAEKMFAQFELHEQCFESGAWAGELYLDERS